MLKRISVVLLLFTTVAAAAAEPVEDLSVEIAGIGSKTCAYWLSGHKSEGEVWIYGFWSSLNYVAAASDQDQSQATSAAMMAAVERLCRREPSRILASAVWSTYLNLNKK